MAAENGRSPDRGGSKREGGRNGARRRRDLPIHACRAGILRAVAGNDSVVLVGETGSGKSTQLPQILADARGLGVGPGAAICVTQPRRVAAVTIARRVAYERGAEVGGEVGYAVRFEDATTAATSIKYATEGILLRECLSDPLLSTYAVVILDEAHERTLNFDVLLGLLKQIQAKRKRRKPEAQRCTTLGIMPWQAVVRGAYHLLWSASPCSPWWHPSFLMIR